MTDIVIYGRGRTGQSLGDLLKKQGRSFVFYDDVMGFDTGGKFAKSTTVLLSPGVYPNAKGIRKAQKVGAKIIGELEYCFPLCSCPCVSVTGTNGKTTVCQLINHLLRNCGKSTQLLGNGGVPFSAKVLSCKKDDIVVLESSSFQLADCKNFRPCVSVLTNLSPDHIDYHGSFENYIRAKQNNFLYQSKDDWAVFNGDDEQATNMALNCPSRALFYSIGDANANCFFDGDNLCLNIGQGEQKVPAPYLKTLYKHNLSNCLCALLVCKVLQADIVKCIDAICSYKFLPHRMQKVATCKGVTFVDDSKGTNVHATKSALECFDENLALILGGSDKGYSFDEIFQCIKSNVKVVCATGQTAKTIALCGVKYGVDVKLMSDIKDCIEYCFLQLKDIGGVILMSNACASFDKFGGYEERGDYFQRVVKQLIEQEI